MTAMQAIRIHSYGETPRVERVPRPEPRGSQVLVHVKAVGVNPLDWAVADGKVRDWLPHDMPLTLGWEVAGVVEDVGPDATRFTAGDEVYGLCDYAGEGADAEYAAIDESALAVKPGAMDFAQTAAVPVGALTAWMALFDAGKLSAGQTVLVHGAAGGVGSVAVQLAKAKGARVIGTASPNHFDLLRDLGCDRMIDYHAAPFDQQLQGEPIDLVVDPIGGDTQRRSYGILKKGGMLVALTEEPDQAEAQRHGVHATMIGVRPDGERLGEISRMIDAGQIGPHVQAVLPLEQAARAFEMSRTGHVGGKVVLTP